MHRSVAEFVGSIIAPREASIRDKHIIEIGSKDVNGSIKGMFLKGHPSSYLGADISTGKNVDLVWDATRLHELPFEDVFDYVICLETLEHIFNWRQAVSNLKFILKPGGHLLFSVRSAGYPDHPYLDYNDYWRFEISDVRKMFDDFVDCLYILDPGTPFERNPGVFFYGRKPLDWHECSLGEIEPTEVVLDESSICAK